MNRKDWRTIRLLLADVMQKDKKTLICMVIRSVINGVSPFISVALTGFLVDAVYSGAPTEQLIRYVLTGTVVICILAVCKAFMEKRFNSRMEYMFESQNRALNEKGVGMNYMFLEDSGIHNMRQKINSANTRFGLVGAALSHLSELIQHGVACITAVVIVLPMFFGEQNGDYGWIGSAWTTLGFVLVLALLVWGNYYSLNFFNNKYRATREQVAPWENRRKFYMDLLGQAETQKDIRMYKQQDMLWEEITDIIKEEKKIQKQSEKYRLYSSAASQITTVLLAICVYAFAGLRGFAGMITIGNVVTYAASISKVSNAIYRTVLRLGWLKFTAGNAEYYVQYMNIEEGSSQGVQHLEHKAEDKIQVSFEHVSFRYPGSDVYAIRDLNLSFEAGGKMAIVGKNGSGKTTFIKLLCRLYDVTEGSIKLNGIDIREYDEQEYCRLFAVVFQDFVIFDFPVGENMACSRQVDEKRAFDALERAGVGERVRHLKDGLQTHVGKGFDENGINFSGGEKQKLAIARAIYKDAPFVIMDEPTAALDPEAECEVFEGFDQMVGKKTAIYISHRLASCRFCEDILVFDKGQMVQRGAHEVLEQQEGIYKQLWNAQAQYYA